MKTGEDQWRYNAMLQAQGGGCAICGRAPTPERALAFDHDHADGNARGLLCTRCNLGLGYFEDDASRLERAGEYIRAHAEVSGLAEFAFSLGVVMLNGGGIITVVDETEP